MFESAYSGNTSDGQLSRTGPTMRSGLGSKPRSSRPSSKRF